jgi:hypothetical protein
MPLMPGHETYAKPQRRQVILLGFLVMELVGVSDWIEFAEDSVDS